MPAVLPPWETPSAAPVRKAPAVAAGKRTENGMDRRFS